MKIGEWWSRLPVGSSIQLGSVNDHSLMVARDKLLVNFRDENVWRTSLYADTIRFQWLMVEFLERGGTITLHLPGHLIGSISLTTSWIVEAVQVSLPNPTRVLALVKLDHKVSLEEVLNAAFELLREEKVLRPVVYAAGEDIKNLCERIESDYNPCK